MIQARTFPTIALTVFLLTIGAAAQKSEAPAPDYFPLRVGDSVDLSQHERRHRTHPEGSQRGEAG